VCVIVCVFCVCEFNGMSVRVREVSVPCTPTGAASVSVVIVNFISHFELQKSL